ncbi:MAG: type II toxin-antitoxin system HicB family antitoxin [Nitrospirae bacterium]|nr:type II toxin-antitoxin system HicB family antitoxin [Nitrospirota bacterium]
MKDYYYKAVIEPQDEGGFTAYVPSLPGCVTEGETYEETMSNMKEALELYLETLKERRRKVKPDTTHIAELHVFV